MVHLQAIQQDVDPQEKWPFLPWALELLLEGVSVIHRGGRLVCPNIRRPPRCGEPAVSMEKRIPSGYVKIAIENGHRNSGFTH